MYIRIKKERLKEMGADINKPKIMSIEKMICIENGVVVNRTPKEFNFNGDKKKIVYVSNNYYTIGEKCPIEEVDGFTVFDLGEKVLY